MRSSRLRVYDGVPGLETHQHPRPPAACHGAAVAGGGGGSALARGIRNRDPPWGGQAHAPRESIQDHTDESNAEQDRCARFWDCRWLLRHALGDDIKVVCWTVTWCA